MEKVRAERKKRQKQKLMSRYIVEGFVPPPPIFITRMMGVKGSSSFSCQLFFFPFFSH